MPNKIGSIVYWSCNKCNTLWFLDREYEYLSLAEVESICKKHKNQAVYPSDKVCPQCSGDLRQNNLGLICTNCAGQLTDCQRLLNYVKNKTTHTQKAFPSISFKQIKTAVVISGIAVLLLINYAIISSLPQKSLTATQASEAIHNLRIKKTNNKYAIIFTTKRPYISQAVIKNKNGNERIITISINPSFAHIIVTNKISPNDLIQIKLSNESGSVIKTKTLPISSLLDQE